MLWSEVSGVENRRECARLAKIEEIGEGFRICSEIGEETVRKSATRSR